MNQEWIKEIQKRVEKVPIASGRSNKWDKISFEDLVFVPAQLSKRPVDYFREKISAKTIIGGNSKKPIELETPILIGAMCYTPDHEVLTEDGFKNITSVKVGEKIWSVSPKTNELELSEVKNLYVYNYNGLVVRAKTQNIDFQVTLEHNIPYMERDEEWKFIKAKDIKKKYLRIPSKFGWRGRKQNYIILPASKIKRPTHPQDAKCKHYPRFSIKEWIKLLGWYITEGYLNPYTHYGVEISQKGSRTNRNSIKSILNKLGIRCRIYSRGIHFNSKEVYECLEQECGRLSENKKIPRSILNLDKNTLWVLFNVLFKGDGNIRITEKGVKRYKYVTISERLKDDMVELGLKLGFACYVSEGKDKAFRIYFRTKRRNNWLSYSKKNLINVHYKGKVYCLELKKNHILIIKRNGKVSCNGNSFGALSREAKTALAKGSTLAGTIENTGEGGVLPEEREFSKYLIVQHSTGRFGITEEILKKADAIEIKIGQGAKAGQGGFLPKEKVTAEIAEIRKIKKGKDVHSPATHLDIKTIGDLEKKVKWLKEITGGKPIIIKLGAGDVENDIRLAVRANPDIIAIDGVEGGTGAAPEVMLNEVGIPTIAALVKAREVLDKIRAPQELWIGGGMNKGGDFAKALALGADAVFLGFPLLVAMGCTYCRLCHLGKCPKGIATQDPELRKKLNMAEASQNIANYIKNCNEEIKMVAGAVGKNNIHDLTKEDLRALVSEIAKITGVRFVGI